MKRLARSWLWLWPLTAFLACLNPQPDEHPLVVEGVGRGNDQPSGASVGGLPDESPVFNEDDTAGEPPPETPPVTASPNPGLSADAGASPAPDAGPPPDAGSGVD